MVPMVLIFLRGRVHSNCYAICHRFRTVCHLVVAPKKYSQLQNSFGRRHQFNRVVIVANSNHVTVVYCFFGSKRSLDPRRNNQFHLLFGVDGIDNRHQRFFSDGKHELFASCPCGDFFGGEFFSKSFAVQIYDTRTDHQQIFVPGNLQKNV